MTRLIPLLALLILSSVHAQENLISNPGLEDLYLPAGWQALNVWGAAPKFSIDEKVFHTGHHSFRISADESTQAWLYSPPIPVAPGETIEAAAWVRFDKLPKKGTTSEGLTSGLILVANFFNADKRTEQFDDFASIGGDAPASEWHELRGKLKVPPLAATLRLRIGMRDTTGTCWIDDVALHAPPEPSIRPNLAGARLTPEMSGVPATIINRGGKTGPATARLRLGGKESTLDVQLTGKKTQDVTLRVAFDKRGELPLEISLYPAGASKFTCKQSVSIPTEMVLSPAIPTHWAIEDGSPQIEGDVDLAITKQQRQAATLTVTLIDKDGKTLASWSRAGNDDGIEDGFNHFHLRPSELPIGDYEIVAELRGQSLKQKQSFAVIHREEARTILNKDGYLEHKGKPIFPLGIFNGHGRDVEMGKAGFTVNHAYNACNVEPGERPNDAGALEYLNDSQKNGMPALFLIPRGLVFSGDWEGFRRRVRMFKNHPGLLAWDEEEGLARGDMDMAGLEKMRRIIREEDPHHPIMIGDSHDEITKIKDRSDFFPLRQMDLGMWWWYPIPAGAGKENLLEGDQYTKAQELTPPSFLTLRKTDKPLWVGVQSYKKPTEYGRFSTPAEYRAQAYIAIIHGAKGLMWYGGSVEGGIFLTPEEGHWNYLKKLARELNDLSPMFMAASDDAPKISPQGAPISAALKRLNDRFILIAANRGTQEIESSMQSPRLSVAEVHVLQEDRKLTITNGELRDHFKSYETHLYEWRAAQ